MAKSKVSEGSKLMEELDDAITVARATVIAESMLLDSVQRNAVIAGLAAMSQGVVKAKAGLAGEYVPPERKKKSPVAA